jgi:hypothetical protein
MLGRRRVHKPLGELTPREHDVLSVMAEGRSNQAISDSTWAGQTGAAPGCRDSYARM